MFLAITGLKVNYSKSLLMGCNVHIDRLHSLATILDVSVGSLPIMYFGAALRDNPRRKIFCDPVLDNMRNKLGLWSSKWLSLSGRMVMLKSVMSAIPIYHMEIFFAPVGVIGDMEKLMRGFLWVEGRAAVGFLGLHGHKYAKGSNLVG